MDNLKNEEGVEIDFKKLELTPENKMNQMMRFTEAIYTSYIDLSKNEELSEEEAVVVTCVVPVLEKIVQMQDIILTSSTIIEVAQRWAEFEKQTLEEMQNENHESGK